MAVADWEERRARAIANGDQRSIYICDRFLAFYSVGIKPQDVDIQTFWDVKWGKNVFAPF